MTVHVGPYEFEHVSYDKRGDVLYLRRAPQRPAADTFGTPEGHAVRLDERGEIIGITIVNAKNGCSIATAASRSRCRAVETDAAELGKALAQPRRSRPSAGATAGPATRSHPLNALSPLEPSSAITAGLHGSLHARRIGF